MKNIIITIIAIVLVLLAVFGLAASNKVGDTVQDNKNNTSDGSHSLNNTTETIQCSFQATVLEINGQTLLVEPMPGTNESNSSNKITVSLKNMTTDWPTPAVGTIIKITYDGNIMETYPAQLGEIYNIELGTPIDNPSPGNQEDPHHDTLLPPND